MKKINIRKLLKLIFLIFLFTFYYYNKSSALDAENAHPWIAEKAGLIWPGTLDNCVSKNIEACTEFDPVKGFLGAYNPDPEVKSGTFTDKIYLYYNN